jgi:hypothetical protein
MKIHRDGGYVELVIILLTTVIIALLVWKFGFLGLGSGGGRSVPQEDLQALQKARDLKATLEQRYR